MGFIFGRSQDSSQTPFDANSLAAIAANISSTNVFDALIEVKTEVQEGMKYPTRFSYNGNAITGRYLEIFSGIDSNIAPFVCPSDSRIIGYTIGAIAASTGQIAVRNKNTLVDLLVVTFTGQTIVSSMAVISSFQPTLSEWEIYVKSGSFSKPFGTIWINTIV